MEQMELDVQRAQLNADVKSLVEKYRSIFEWDVPDIDQMLSDRLILLALREALDETERTLSTGGAGDETDLSIACPYPPIG
jgi:hypothetical protein